MIRSEFEAFEPGAWQEDGLLRAVQTRRKRFISPSRDLFRAALTAAIASAVVTVSIGSSSAAGLSVRSQESAEIHRAVLVDSRVSGSVDTVKLSRELSPESREAQTGEPSPEYWAKLMSSMKGWKRLPDDDPNDDIDPPV